MGINLQTADTVVIFDSDWNPQMDKLRIVRTELDNRRRCGCCGWYALELWKSLS